MLSCLVVCLTAGGAALHLCVRVQALPVTLRVVMGLGLVLMLAKQH